MKTLQTERSRMVTHHYQYDQERAVFICYDR